MSGKINKPDIIFLTKKFFLNDILLLSSKLSSFYIYIDYTVYTCKWNKAALVTSSFQLIIELKTIIG